MSHTGFIQLSWPDFSFYRSVKRFVRCPSACAENDCRIEPDWQDAMLISFFPKIVYRKAGVSSTNEFVFSERTPSGENGTAQLTAGWSDIPSSLASALFLLYNKTSLTIFDGWSSERRLGCYFPDKIRHFGRALPNYRRYSCQKLISVQ